MKSQLHFVLGAGVYPYLTGGMEIFNYYLIQTLCDNFKISYTSYFRLNYKEAKFKRCLPIRPTKYFFPIQLFFHLLFARKVKCVIFSFSSAHVIVWRLYNLICRILHKKYVTVIHYGNVTPSNDIETYKRFFCDAEIVIAVSEDIKKNYDFKYGINCKVIYPLVPFSEAKIDKQTLRNKYHIPNGPHVICMIGSLKNMKNPDTIIEALKLFSPEELKQFNPYIVYAGNGASREYLKKKAAEYKLENRISFLGNIPKEKVKDIYKLSDYYLIASDFEGTSVSLLEAMFNRKPIIASRVPGIVNTIREGKECQMFTVKNAAELKECLIQYIQQPQLAKDLSLKAYEHYLYNYNYDNVVAEYIKILNPLESQYENNSNHL